VCSSDLMLPGYDFTFILLHVEETQLLDLIA